MLIDTKKVGALGYTLVNQKYYTKDISKGLKLVIQVEPNSNKVVSRYFKIEKLSIIKGDDLDFITQTFNDFRNDYLSCVYKEEEKLLNAEEVSWLRVFLGNTQKIKYIERVYENNMTGLKFYNLSEKSFFVPVMNGFAKLKLYTKYEVEKLL